MSVFKYSTVLNISVQVGRICNIDEIGLFHSCFPISTAGRYKLVLQIILTMSSAMSMNAGRHVTALAVSSSVKIK